MVDATQPAAEDSGPVNDDALLAMAEHHEDAAALRQMLADRALLRLVLAAGGSR